jgi:hypothetical protein
MKLMNDRYGRACLTTIAVLLGLLVVGQYSQISLSPRSADAQYAPSEKEVVPLLPDSARQRDAMITEMKATNAKLAEIQKMLASGQIKVVVAEAENTTEGAHVLPPKTK